MKIQILCIGDEILSGNVINTNASWLADQLWIQGFEITRHLTIGDDEPAMLKAFQEALMIADITLVTGGLGPTADDFTLEVASKTFQLSMETDATTLKRLTNFYAQRNRTMTPNQERQAKIPQGGKILENQMGTAPGLHLTIKNHHFFFLPGVPQEMKKIFTDSIAPWLKIHRTDSLHFAGKILRCFGAEEAKLDHLLRPLFENRVYYNNAKIAFRVNFPDILIKISCWGNSAIDAQTQLDSTLPAIQELIKNYLYGEELESLEGKVGELLKNSHQTLALAESCSGGLMGHRFTQLAGSSQYFQGGVIAYSNEVKKNLLGVSEKTLQKYGAVSEEVALEMARGAKERLQSNFGISITGIAGPEGGSPEKPVGTFHIAIASDFKSYAKKFYFPIDRERFKQLAVSVALNELRKLLLELA